MPSSPYYNFIQRYFPEGEWEHADCISTKECDPSRQGYPQSCIGYEGWISCGHGPKESNSWGVFQILDACWNPAMNPNSPFTHEQWAKVLDPNVNTWMASVIFRRGGWGRCSTPSPDCQTPPYCCTWTTCSACGICDVGPPVGWEPLPAPIDVEPPPPPPPPPPPILTPEVVQGLLLTAGLGLMIGGIIVLERSQHGHSL